MPKSTIKPTERPCKDCNMSIQYVNRRVRCLKCYNKYIKNSDDDIKFIPDEDCFK